MSDKSLAELKAELLKKPGVREVYDQLAPEYEFARAMIEARAAAGLTQAQLAERMNTSQSYIARIESGRAAVTTDTLLRLGKATNTRPRLRFEAVRP